MAAPEGTHAPGGHPRTLSRPSGAGKGHQSHPQDSRRPEDNHAEMVSLANGTAAGDHHKSPPTKPAGHSVPRVCVAGGNGMSPSGGLRGRRASILGTAVQLGRRGYDSVHFL